MKTNEGQMDRALRVAVGIVLVGLTAAGGMGAWGWIGLVPLATGLGGFCPLYRVLGVTSLPRRSF
ncbi:MAG TPA: DUF2892 domain-containing protein [Ramlibacter sp.]|jgi:hypothetical protein